MPPLSRSFRPYLTFWFSHIARYVPSPARPIENQRMPLKSTQYELNMTRICDPCITFFCGMGS